jgi:branched-chain amino acid transport system substrate-binding protein
MKTTSLARTIAVALVAAAPAHAQDALKFGLAMPLSGGQALYGQDQVKAAEWAVSAINASGGVNGKKLDMIILDTKADPPARS